jgi:hypothetical protein
MFTPVHKQPYTYPYGKSVCETTTPRPQRTRPWSSNHLGTRASLTWQRRTETRETNGGEEDDSSWSEGSAHGDDSFAPRGGSGNHQSSSESRDDAVGDVHSRERERGLGLGFARGRLRVGLSPTGPGWSDLTHSSRSDQWAQV